MVPGYWYLKEIHLFSTAYYGPAIRLVYEKTKGATSEGNLFSGVWRGGGNGRKLTLCRVHEHGILRIFLLAQISGLTMGTQAATSVGENMGGICRRHSCGLEGVLCN